MVKISDCDPNQNSNYIHLVGDKDLGLLLSQVHSAQIKQGRALEKHINKLISRGEIIAGVWDIANKRSGREVVIKPHKPKIGKENGVQCDYAVILHDRSKVIVIELKSSSHFDTQKAPAAYEKLNEMGQYVSHPGLGYQVDIALCAFFASDPSIICNDLNVKGALFKQSEVLTGLQLCDLLGISFEDVMNKIIEDQPENKNYILMIAERVRQGLPITPEEFIAQQEKARQLELSLYWYGGRNGAL